MLAAVSQCRVRIAPARRPALRAVVGVAHSHAEVPLYDEDHRFDRHRYLV
jgi:hypothetical protein